MTEEESGLRAILDMWENMEEEQRLSQLKFLINEGFQKGKLEQRKKEIIFLQDLIFQDSITIIKEDVRDRIKQLSKEIGGMK